MSLDVIIATTARQLEDAFSVRIAVFVDEQGIPRSDELDALDATAVHCVAYRDGAPVGAGRVVIVPAHDGGAAYAKIGRMAVLREHRGEGVGAQVLHALERAASERGVRHLKLSAQLQAQGFYRGEGYAPAGDVYDEVGIPHIAMEKTVSAPAG